MYFIIIIIKLFLENELLLQYLNVFYYNYYHVAIMTQAKVFISYLYINREKNLLCIKINTGI